MHARSSPPRHGYLASAPADLDAAFFVDAFFFSVLLIFALAFLDGI
jgi:hypothetical protein